jgi:hypothetical protein
MPARTYRWLRPPREGSMVAVFSRFWKPSRMNVDKPVNIEDLHRMARRPLPKIAFDFIEGVLEDERGLERNTAGFHRHLAVRGQSLALLRIR